VTLKAIYVLLVAGLALSPFSVLAGEPTYKQGENIFIETGADQPDRVPTWYASMVTRPYAPVFEILTTRGTQGRYYPYTFAVTLKDIVKWHGHDCEGLTHAANFCKVAFKILFPDGIIDRSVLGGITGPSPCFSDTVAFLTGARVQYGNLGFFKEKKYGHAAVLYREDTEVAVLATWKKGINSEPGEPVVLPEAITWTPRVSMKEMVELKEVVKKAGRKPTPYQMDLMRFHQWSHINDILGRPLEESYQAGAIEKFRWEEWADSTRRIPSPIQRSDIRLKDYPYRTKPIEGPK
jgi:formylmethanofuran dehydrogenase subunit E